MKKEVRLKYSNDLDIFCNLYPVENPISLVQIVHGAAEHSGRYDKFARYLQDNNIAVIASDNPGHGHSVSEKYPLGYMNSMKETIKCLNLVTDYIKQMYPGKNLCLFGHSFGSLIARNYIIKNDDKINKLILSGIVKYNKGAKVGRKLIKAMSGFKNDGDYIRFFGVVSGLEGPDKSWLTHDKEVIKKYKEDPLCGKFRYRVGGYNTLFESIENLKDYNMYKVKNKDLKILITAGEEDTKITGGNKGIKESQDILKTAGYQNIKTIIYPNMRHEILNEIGKEKVYRDILDFILE